MEQMHEYRIELNFEKRSDGYYHIYSPHVPGLHLGGTDLGALVADIEPVVKDLLWENRKITADHIRWIPPLDDVQRQLLAPEAKEVFLVEVRRVG